MDNQQNHRLTAEEYEVRIWGFVVIMVTLVLVFIVVMLLYSVTFVTQPIKSMAPIDQAYTKMLNDIVLLIVGGIGGIMTKRVTKSLSQNLAGATQTYQPSAYPNQCPQAPVSFVPQSGFSYQSQSGALPTWVNPPLDETWTPGPPPTTPPDYLDPEREDIAHERNSARNES